MIRLCVCVFVMRVCVCVCVCHEGVCVCACDEGVCVCVRACLGGHLRVAKDHHILNIISHTMHSYIAGIQRFLERETTATISELIWFTKK